MARLHTEERGSALMESALVAPCLVLAVYWSAALTDVLLLKLKAAEAVRYALWETTVFKSPRQIDRDVQRRFGDLRSPRHANASHTGLVLYPLAKDLTWRADVDTTSTPAGLGGTARIPAAGGPWDRFIDALGGSLSKAVDPAAAQMRFNVRGVAVARISLHARRRTRPMILGGGDLPGDRGGNALGGRSLDDFTFQAPLSTLRPLQLVFDTWKAWPRPAPYTFTAAGTDMRTSPSRTYPEVEKQVSAQIGAVAFPAVNRVPGFQDLRGLVARVFRAGITKAVVGGTLPDIFSTDRMDDPTTTRGPITILPPEQPAESWVPHLCEAGGRDVPCPAQRVGDITTAESSPRYLDDEHGVGQHVDRTRYTVPYRIQTPYWKRSGGIDRELESGQLERVKAGLATDNGYVRSYRCRGHFFGGSREAQAPNRFGSCR
jgi:hypothetical protein